MRWASLFLAMIAVCFVQVGSSAHAVANGDEPHTHGEIECTLKLAGDRLDDDDLIAPGDRTLHPLAMTSRIVRAFTARALIVPTVTAHPPGRAPPLFS